jgi:outer membrane protein assembly factor BamD (BamD/ComL family)
MLRKFAYVAAVLTVAFVLGSISSGQPQTSESNKRDAQQPDKALYDHGVKAIEQKQFPSARLMLQTLINTYESSELLPKAHLALAESWRREGGAKNLGRAHDECKQLIMAYPGAPEAKEAEEMLRNIEAVMGKQGSAPPQ